MVRTVGGKTAGSTTILAMLMVDMGKPVMETGAVFSFNAEIFIEIVTGDC